MAEGTDSLFVNWRTGKPQQVDSLPAGVLILKDPTGSEGGEFRLEIPTGSSLSGGYVTIDLINPSVLRVFESSGALRGFTIDIAECLAGAGTNLLRQLQSFTVGTVPTAAVAGQLIYVSDESGGAVPAFSDGSNWRRVTDRNVIS